MWIVPVRGVVASSRIETTNEFAKDTNENVDNRRLIISCAARAGHGTAQQIMDAGARGCLVVLSGKITGARHRVEKFQQGHIKFCGETALEFMDTGFSTAVKKLGTIGCTVKIMRPDAKLPHEIVITERADSGLPPLAEVAVFETSDEKAEELVAEAEEPEDWASTAPGLPLLLGK